MDGLCNGLDVLTLECLGAHVTLSEIYVDLADLSVA